MEVLPCSRVAHIERTRKPYNNDIDYYAKRNALRAAEVWMDGFKSHVYMAWNIPMTVSRRPGRPSHREQLSWEGPRREGPRFPALPSQRRPGSGLGRPCRPSLTLSRRAEPGGGLRGRVGAAGPAPEAEMPELQVVPGERVPRDEDLQQHPHVRRGTACTEGPGQAASHLGRVPPARPTFRVLTPQCPSAPASVHRHPCARVRVSMLSWEARLSVCLPQ